MTGYIKTDELLDVLNSQDLADWLDKQEEYTPASIVEHALETLSTVDAVPVRHGKWITKSTGGECFDCCSECGYIEWDAPNKYCPNCGARMDAERKEE